MPQGLGADLKQGTERGFLRREFLILFRGPLFCGDFFDILT